MTLLIRCYLELDIRSFALRGFYLTSANVMSASDLEILKIVEVPFYPYRGSWWPSRQPPAVVTAVRSHAAPSLRSSDLLDIRASMESPQQVAHQMGARAFPVHVVVRPALILIALAVPPQASVHTTIPPIWSVAVTVSTASLQVLLAPQT